MASVSLLYDLLIARGTVYLLRAGSPYGKADRQTDRHTLVNYRLQKGQEVSLVCKKEAGLLKLLK